LNLESRNLFTLKHRSATGGIQIQTDANNTSPTWEFGADGNLTLPLLGGTISGKAYVNPPVSLSSLPAAVAGARSFVNNANLVATGNFGRQISGGGSNTVPVWSDGTNWYIG
jgi:hypothetical protein